jgi:hypothetical protein
LLRHEETRVPSDLAKFRITHLSLDDGVDETESEGVLLHFHGVQVIESELRNALNYDGEVATEKGFRGFKIDLLILLCCGEDIVSNRNVLHEDGLQLGGMGSQNFIFLESFKRIGAKVGNKCGSVDVTLLFFFFRVRLGWSAFTAHVFVTDISRELLSGDLNIALNETNGVSMNNSVVLTSDSKVVSY